MLNAKSVLFRITISSIFSILETICLRILDDQNLNLKNNVKEKKKKLSEKYMIGRELILTINYLLFEEKQGR